FAGFAVADQPVVGVAAVVALAHDLGVAVNGVGVLQRLARAHEFGNAVGIPAVELRDGGFADHQPVGVDAEIVIAGNHARNAVHKDVVAVLRRDVEHYRPARAYQVAGPVVVRDDNLVVLGVAARGHEGAAVAG